MIDAYGRKRLDLEKEILRNETHLAKLSCLVTKNPEHTCDYYRMPEEQLLDILRRRQEDERSSILRRESAKRVAVRRKHEAERISQLKSQNERYINSIIDKFKHKP